MEKCAIGVSKIVYCYQADTIGYIMILYKLYSIINCSKEVNN